MTPTPELRWVERKVTMPFKSGEPNFAEIKIAIILQQKWVEVRSSDVYWVTPLFEEWRDVPTVREET